jgi:hypothetical protein
MSNLLTTLKGFVIFFPFLSASSRSLTISLILHIQLLRLRRCHGHLRLSRSCWCAILPRLPSPAFIGLTTSYYSSGIVGLVFTGVFAQASITATDGYTVIPGGWLDGNYVQVGKQLAYVFAVWGWTFVVSYILMTLINRAFLSS